THGEARLLLHRDGPAKHRLKFLGDFSSPALDRIDDVAQAVVGWRELAKCPTPHATPRILKLSIHLRLSIGQIDGPAPHGPELLERPPSICANVEGASDVRSVCEMGVYPSARGVR